MSKRVTITVDFLIMDDSEVDCFLEDTMDVDGQGDTLKDWLREAPYNHSVSYKITDDNKTVAKGDFNLYDNNGQYS